MFRLIFTVVVTLFIWVPNIFANAKEDKLFKELSKLESQKVKKAVKAKPRFKYFANNFKARTYRSVILADSMVESLDGTKFYKITKNTIIKTREVSPGSLYFFIIPKDENVKYVTQGKNLNHLETILTFHDETYKPFNRKKFDAIEYDKKLIQSMLQLKAGLGTSTPAFFLDNTTLNSSNFIAELGVETFQNIPVFLNLEYMSQNSGQDVQFSTISIGLRSEYRYKLNSDSFIAAGISAQRSLYSSADILGSSVGHSLDSFGININYNYKSYILSLDYKKQNYSFDSGVFFPNTTLQSSNNADAILFSIGKEFKASI